jgi:hypothetical protein
MAFDNNNVIVILFLSESTILDWQFKEPSFGKTLNICPIIHREVHLLFGIPFRKLEDLRLYLSVIFVVRSLSLHLRQHSFKRAESVNY